VIPIALMSAAASVPQVKAGRIRAVAVARPVKIAIAPDWPALAETLPGFEAYTSHFMVAPAGTPPEVIARLSEALRNVLSAEETKRAYVAQGATAEYVPPQALAARIESQVRRWASVAKESGARND
jgi:tripartite-type tricarboxylate transporter receptor subunit TctC